MCGWCNIIHNIYVNFNYLRNIFVLQLVSYSRSWFMIKFRMKIEISSNMIDIKDGYFTRLFRPDTIFDLNGIRIWRFFRIRNGKTSIKKIKGSERGWGLRYPRPGLSCPVPKFSIYHFRPVFRSPVIIKIIHLYINVLSKLLQIGIIHIYTYKFKRNPDYSRVSPFPIRTAYWEGENFPFRD